MRPIDYVFDITVGSALVGLLAEMFVNDWQGTLATCAVIAALGVGVGNKPKGKST